MSVVLEIRRRGRQIAGPIFGLLLFTYFVLHAIQGDRGLLAWLQIRQQIVLAEAKQATAATERAGWERRVNQMRGEHLDADLLDERARLLTGLVRDDELVVYYGLRKPSR
ncbi:MAG: septum formation initiator family protein [Alphaproteobacteria bacterium]